MKKVSFATLVMVCLGTLLSPSGALAQGPTVSVVASISVRLPVSRNADLEDLVKSFAAKNGFSNPENNTLPHNRKILLPPGVFSLLFRAADGHYLLMHNVSGQDCVLIAVYAPHEDAKYQALLNTLSQSVQDKFKQDAKVFSSSKCEDAM
ncbi:MAG: hypothetical protein ACRETO_04540 [Gammaproteobacteria bacterium]